MDKLSIPTPHDIEKAAKARGWSILRLCKEAGISNETFFRWRDRRNSISVDKLRALVAALNKPEKSTD